MIILPHKMELPDHLFAAHAVTEIVNVWDWVTVGYSNIVKWTTITAWSSVSSYFWDHVDWRCPWGEDA